MGDLDGRNTFDSVASSGLGRGTFDSVSSAGYPDRISGASKADRILDDPPSYTRLSKKGQKRTSNSGANSVANSVASNRSSRALGGVLQRVLPRRNSHDGTSGLKSETKPNKDALVRRNSSGNVKVEKSADLSADISMQGLIQNLQQRRHSFCGGGRNAAATAMNQRQVHDSTANKAAIAMSQRQLYDSAKNKEKFSSGQGIGDKDKASSGQSEWVSKIVESLADSKRSQTNALLEYVDEMMMPTGTDQQPSWNNLSAEQRSKVRQKITQSLDAVAYGAGKTAFEQSSEALEDKKRCELEIQELLEQKNHMQTSYLKEVSLLRAAAGQKDRAVEAAIDHVEASTNIEYYEPMKYIDPEMRNMVMSVVDMKIQSIFKYDPGCQEKANQIEMAKLDSSKLKIKLEVSEKKVAELQKQLKDVEARYMKQGQMLDRVEWELSDLKVAEKKTEEKRAAEHSYYVRRVENEKQVLRDEKQELLAHQAELERRIAVLSKNETNLKNRKISQDFGKASDSKRNSLDFGKDSDSKRNSLDFGHRRSAGELERKLRDLVTPEKTSQLQALPPESLQPSNGAAMEKPSFDSPGKRSRKSSLDTPEKKPSLVSSRKSSTASIMFDKEMENVDVKASPGRPNASDPGQKTGLTGSMDSRRRPSEGDKDEGLRRALEKERCALEEQCKNLEAEVERSTVKADQAASKARKMGEQLEILTKEADELRKELKMRERESARGARKDHEVSELRATNAKLRVELEAAQKSLAQSQTGASTQTRTPRVLPGAVPPKNRNTFMSAPGPSVTTPASHVPASSSGSAPEQDCSSKTLGSQATAQVGTEALQAELSILRKELEEARGEKTQLQAGQHLFKITRDFLANLEGASPAKDGEVPEKDVVEEAARVMGPKDRAEMGIFAREMEKLLNQKEALQTKAKTANGCLEAVKRENRVLQLTLDEVFNKVLAIPNKLFQALSHILDMNLSGEAREVIFSECSIDFTHIRAMLDGENVDPDDAKQRSKIASARLAQDGKLKNVSKDNGCKEGGPRRRSTGGLPNVQSASAINNNSQNAVQPKLLNDSNSNVGLEEISCLRVGANSNQIKPEKLKSPRQSQGNRPLPLLSSTKSDGKAAAGGSERSSVTSGLAVLPGSSRSARS